ncbi:hypothetical protein [Pseudomonas aeruginosa]|uniref:hypothetical protein n=1 Tax=Pseudomonas aeruginosa TaxID=287 RepID=UPI003459C0C6
MLQAATGKLFTYGIDRTNTLRGVLYSNISFLAEEQVDTIIGSIHSLSSRSFPNVFNCTITENIELTASGPGILVSNCIDVYIQDFADVVSFVLGVTCTPDMKMAERILIEKSRTRRESDNPILERYFSPDIVVSAPELTQLKLVATDLIGLRRSQYLAAIKAIRSYITAVYRSKDDLDLAYTLLIISLESLVQNFDNYKTSWPDLNESKRKPIDEALEGLPAEASAAIRDAILSGEHVALSRRFKQFVKSHVPIGYFDKLAESVSRPVGKKDFDEALSNLYQTRSKYVHELVALPRNMRHGTGAETIVVDEKMLFSFQGLLRLTKAVILEFISRQEKIEKEPCNYSVDNPNIMTAKLCPSMWISDTRGLSPQNCFGYFNGFVDLIGKFYEEYPNGKIYDVRDVIRIGLKFKGLKLSQKRALLGMHFIFNSFVHSDQQSKIKIPQGDIDAINSPSLESLIAHAILGMDTEWDAKEQEKNYKSYYKQRFNKTGLLLSNKVEACLGLALAERYRLSGNIKECLDQILVTADDYPSLRSIRELAVDFDSEKPIQWISLIYPETRKPRATLECSGL